MYAAENLCICDPDVLGAVHSLLSIERAFVPEGQKGIGLSGEKITVERKKLGASGMQFGQNRPLVQFSLSLVLRYRRPFQSSRKYNRFLSAC